MDVATNKILILCKECNAKNRVDTTLKDKVIRCGKCGKPLPLDLNESMAPAITRIRDAAGRVKMDYEDYTRFKVCSITVDMVEDTLHVKWKVETDIEDLWRLKQRWIISYYYTLKMFVEVFKQAEKNLGSFAISFFERYLNFSPEDEGPNFRDLCLLSVRSDSKKLKELEKKLAEKDYLTLKGSERQEAMDELQEYVRENLDVRQNYRGTLVNKASLIYKSVKPYDLTEEDEQTKVEEAIKTEAERQEDKKVAAIKIIEENIEKLGKLDTPYVRIFAKKYGLGNEERRNNLRELIESKNIRLPEKVLYRLIQKELDEIEYERFVKKIKSEEKLPLNHYIRRYLELIPDKDDQIEHFYRFLVEESIIIEDVSTNAQKLADTVNKMEKSISLEQFEKSLFEDEAEEHTEKEPAKKEEVPVSSIDPNTESYQFLKHTISPGKPGGVAGVIRLYIDNFMDNPLNRAMLLYFFRDESVVTDINTLDIDDEIKKIQYEDIPESIEEEVETFDSYSSNEIISNFEGFDFNKRLHLTRYVFERMGFNARIVDKHDKEHGIIFLDNKEDEKLIVKYFHGSDVTTGDDLAEVVDLVNSYHADYGIAVCRGTFDKDAMQFALENDIELIDRDKVKRLIMNIF